MAYNKFKTVKKNLLLYKASGIIVLLEILVSVNGNSPHVAIAITEKSMSTRGLPVS